MQSIFTEIIWQQFGAAIDMLGNTLTDCPDELWQARLYEERRGPPGFAEFWYIGSHVIFWLDYYLSETFEGFTPPAPFDLCELDPAGKLPYRVYTKTELLDYLEHGRRKCRSRLESLTDEMLIQERSDWHGMTVAGSIFYTMRHVQEHAAQLSLFLGQKIGYSSRWVSKAKE